MVASYNRNRSWRAQIRLRYHANFAQKQQAGGAQYDYTTLRVPDKDMNIIHRMLGPVMM